MTGRNIVPFVQKDQAGPKQLAVGTSPQTDHNYYLMATDLFLQLSGSVYGPINFCLALVTLKLLSSSDKLSNRLYELLNTSSKKQVPIQQFKYISQDASN